MSKQTSRKICMALMAGLMMVGCASAPAWAQGHFGVTGGLYQVEDDDADRTEVFGVRGGYRFHPNFGFEGSLTRVDLADAASIEDDPALPGFDLDFQLDLYNLDLSLQWFPGGGNFVVFAGPGLARLDTEVEVSFLGERFSESANENIFTAHAGLGYEWQLNERFFIRPEVRARRYFDDEPDDDFSEEEGLEVSYEATDYEAAVTFGWRIGG